MSGRTASVLVGMMILGGCSGAEECGNIGNLQAAKQLVGKQMTQFLALMQT